MKKVLLVASVQSHIAQFHKPLLQWLEETGCRVDVAARDNLALKPDLHLEVPGEIFDVPFSRSPLHPGNIRAWFALRKIIRTGSYDVIHCNTPVAGILTRMAANPKRKRGETKVLYEAHGFHFFPGGPKKSWILWYPIEKWFSRYTDVLVTVNRMDYALACEKFQSEKIVHLPGVGLDLSRFQNAEKPVDLKAEYLLSADSKIVMSVGELNQNKNQQSIIRAVAYLQDPRIHYFVVGNGLLEKKLRRLSRKLGVEDSIHFLGYRRDVPALLKNADVFVLPSLREGLGMSAIEAMASGLPVITSNRHGINDYSENGVTGYKYDPRDYRGFAGGIRRILFDDALRERMGKHNIEMSRQFTVEKSLGKLTEVYRELLDF